MQKKGAIAVADLISQLCDSPISVQEWKQTEQYPACAYLLWLMKKVRIRETACNHSSSFLS